MATLKTKPWGAGVTGAGTRPAPPLPTRLRGPVRASGHVPGRVPRGPDSSLPPAPGGDTPGVRGPFPALSPGPRPTGTVFLGLLGSAARGLTGNAKPQAAGGLPRHDLGLQDDLVVLLQRL